MSAGQQQQHHHAAAPSKTSSDSGQQPGLDRWSQRRLQRLNTEQGFRDQRSGQVQSPPLPSAAASGSEQLPPSSSHSSSHSYAGTQYSDAQPPPQPLQHHPPQPQQQQQQSQQQHQQQHQQQQQTGYQTPRAGQPNVGLAINTLPTNNSSRPSQYSPPGQYTPQETSRPELTQSRSFTQQGVLADDASSMSNNGSMPAPKATRTGNGNRQSVHAGMMSREGSYAQQGGQAPPYNAAPISQVQQYKNAQGQPQLQQQQPIPGEIGRGTPQPAPVGEEMSEEDVAQLVKDHKELRKWLMQACMSCVVADPLQVRNIQKSKSTTSRRKTRSSSCRTVSHISVYHSLERPSTTANIPPDSTGWMGSLLSWRLASVKAGRAYPNGWSIQLTEMLSLQESRR